MRVPRGTIAATASAAALAEQLTARCQGGGDGRAGAHGLLAVQAAWKLASSAFA